jgi:hypothetical protein
VALHVCTSFDPSHRVWPGAQLPEHAPFTHVLLLDVHDVPTVHVPVELQVSGWLVPVQATAPATHVPAQLPLTQVCVLAVQDVPVTHAPVALHVWTSFDPSHWV